MGLQLVGNSRTVIANLNHSATVVAVGSNAKLAFSVHRVNRVIDNVSPDLVELAPKRIHEKWNAQVVAVYHNSLFQLVIQDRKCGFQALYDVHVLHRRLVHVGVFLDCADQIRYPRGAALDFVQQTRDLRRSGDPDQSSSGGVSVQVGEQRFKDFRLDVPPRKIGRQLPQIVLSMTPQQRINLIFQVAGGQGIRWNGILLRKRSFQSFDL